MPSIPVSKARHVLAERLCTHAKLSAAEVEDFKYFCTASAYFSLPDHRGGAVAPGSKHYRRSGEEFTYDDVPWKAILKGAESQIKQADPAERTEMFKAVMKGLPGAKASPDWEKEPKNPNAKPTTDWSAYRAKNGEDVFTNPQMLAAFGQAAGLGEDRIKSIAANITWWDAMGDETRPALFTPSQSRVKGGRLGRDHTWDDVPFHYARDMLMDYAFEEFDEDKQDAVFDAICPDLYKCDTIEYATHIAKAKVKRSKEDDWSAVPWDMPSRFEKRTQDVKGPIPQDGLEHVMEFALAGSKRTPGEVNNKLQEDLILDAIDDTISLTPIPHFKAMRTDLRPVEKSVVKPGPMKPGKTSAEPLPDEEKIEALDEDIDQDCDQVRAMIKMFLKENGWTTEQFRGAIGLGGRNNMIEFLEKKGRTYGMDCAPYQLSWEFFKRRQKLNLPFKSACSQNVAAEDQRAGGDEEENVLRERGSENRGRKRRSEAALDDDEKIATKAVKVNDGANGAKLALKEAAA